MVISTILDDSAAKKKIVSAREKREGGEEGKECATLCDNDDSGDDDDEGRNYTCNRLLLCCVAICLLWMTSLQICVAVVNKYITIPPIDIVVDHCQYAYKETQKQRAQYYQCATQQTSTCESELAKAVVEEDQQIALFNAWNEEFLDKYAESTANCSALLTTAKSALSTWVRTAVPVDSEEGGSSDYSIVYNNYDIHDNPSNSSMNYSTFTGTVSVGGTCSDTERSAIATMLGDYTSSSVGAGSGSDDNILSLAAAYVAGTDNTVQRMSKYASEYNQYNMQYLDNKTDHLRRVVGDVVNGVSIGLMDDLLWNQTMEALNTAVEELLSCISLKNSSSASSSSSSLASTTSSSNSSAAASAAASGGGGLSVSSSYPNVCSLGTSVRSVLDDVFRRMELHLSGIERQYEDIQDNLEEFADDLHTALNAADEFFEAISGAAGLVEFISDNIDILGMFGVNFDLCAQTNPNFCHFSPSDWYIAAPFVPPMPYIPVVPDLSAVWTLVQPAELAVVTAISEKLSSAQAQFNADVLSLDTAVGSIDFTPSDYDPPPYFTGDGANNSIDNIANWTAEVSSQLRRSTLFSTALKAEIYDSNASDTLNTFSSPTTVEDSGTSFFSVVNVSSQVTATVLSGFKAAWAPFTKTNIDITALVDSLVGLQGFLYMFDIVYRLLQTIALIRKFWGRGVVLLPVLDLRIVEDKTEKAAKAEGKTEKFSNSQRASTSSGFWTKLWGSKAFSVALRVMPLLWMQVLLVLALFLVLIWGVAAVVIPEYNSYVAVCVEGSQNTTFISRNLYSAAMNYAALDGNTAITASISSYNLKAAEQCNNRVVSTTLTFTNQIASAQILNVSHHELILGRDIQISSSSSSGESDASASANAGSTGTEGSATVTTTNTNSVRSLVKCVNISAMDFNFARACCGGGNTDSSASVSTSAAPYASYYSRYTYSNLQYACEDFNFQSNDTNNSNNSSSTNTSRSSFYNPSSNAKNNRLEQQHECALYTSPDTGEVVPFLAPGLYLADRLCSIETAGEDATTAANTSYLLTKRRLTYSSRKDGEGGGEGGEGGGTKDIVSAATYRYNRNNNNFHSTSADDANIDEEKDFESYYATNTSETETGTAEVSEAAAAVDHTAAALGLQNSIFQCNQLPECRISCSGPHPPIMESTTKTCSCFVEWFINGYMLQITISILVYLLVNASRMLFCNGLLRVLWFLLTPPVFEYIGTCSQTTEGEMVFRKTTAAVLATVSGKQLLPSSSSSAAAAVLADVDYESELLTSTQGKINRQSISMTMNEQQEYDCEKGRCEEAPVLAQEGQEKEGGDEEKEEKEEKLYLGNIFKSQVRRHVLLGYGMVCLAVLLNVPWIVLLVKWTHDLQYEPYA